MSICSRDISTRQGRVLNPSESRHNAAGAGKPPARAASRSRPAPTPGAITPAAAVARPCNPTASSKFTGRLVESKSIRASLRFVLQRRPFTWSAPRNSRGFEPARCRVRLGDGGWPPFEMRPQPPCVPLRILLPPRAFMRGGDVLKSRPVRPRIPASGPRHAAPTSDSAAT